MMQLFSGSLLEHVHPYEAPGWRDPMERPLERDA